MSEKIKIKLQGPPIPDGDEITYRVGIVTYFMSNEPRLNRLLEQLSWKLEKQEIALDTEPDWKHEGEGPGIDLDDENSQKSDVLAQNISVDLRLRPQIPFDSLCELIKIVMADLE